MLLNIILSDFQQYRTLLAKGVSPEKCKNQRYEFLTPDRRYAAYIQVYFRLDFFTEANYFNPV